MSPESLPLFAAAIFILAVLPGPGILLTVARALHGGIYHAAFTVVGIVLADIIFILFVTLGLKAIAESLSILFIIIKYLGGAYLIYLGLSLLLNPPTSKAMQASIEQPIQPFIQTQKKKNAFFVDIASGLSITLSNPKAIVFYLSFLPAFVDIPTLQPLDIVIISATVVSIVGGVMMAYAIAAIKTKSLFSTNNSNQWIKKIAGICLIGTGGWLIVRS